MRAVVFTGPGEARLIEAADPEVPNAWATVAPSWVGLCGTDLELFMGTMAYFGSNDASYPLQPGHEVVGLVAVCQSEPSLVGAVVLIDPIVGCGSCSACLAGTFTRCRDRHEMGVRRGMPGGLADRIAVPSRNLHPLPSGLAPRDAVFAEPGVTVLHAVDRLGDVSGASALVVGGGTLGLLGVQLLRARGADVEVLLDEPERVDLAEAVGVPARLDPPVRAHDVVLEAAGTPEAVRAAVQAAAPGGRVALVGLSGRAVDGFDADGVVLNDLTLHGALSGPGRFDTMLELLATGAVDASLLVDSEFALEDFEGALQRMSSPDRARPKVLVQVDGPKDRP
jgi:threonine dehydrogenase-like Zn-dependent dehydrogenase